MNIYAIIVNEILVNLSQRHVKNTIHHDHVGFIQEMHERFNISIRYMQSNIQIERHEPHDHFTRWRNTL